MSGIWWLASYPKSGNTWVRVFLANLLFNPERPFDINQIPKVTFSDSMGGPYARLANQPIGALSRTDVLRLRPRVQHMLANQGVDLLFAKTHSAVATIEGSPTFDLKRACGAVCILRNPLDVAVSFASHLGIGYAEAIKPLCSPTISAYLTTGQACAGRPGSARSKPWPVKKKNMGSSSSPVKALNFSEKARSASGATF